MVGINKDRAEIDQARLKHLAVCLGVAVSRTLRANAFRCRIVGLTGAWGRDSMKHGIPLAALAALAACSQGKSGATGAAFDPAGLRAAEARLVAHLQDDDSLAWVADYTEDAVFQEGEAPPVSGRAALTELDKSLGPLSSVSIEPVRTVGEGNLAYVQVH